MNRCIGGSREARLTVRRDSCIYILGEKHSDYLYLSSIYLIILVFLAVAVVKAEVFYYSAVTVLINGSGSVTLDSFPWSLSLGRLMLNESKDQA